MTFYIGWAMDAYPEMTADEIRAHVRRQKDAGCNFVWAGHNNPGEANADKVEPAMSYAVYDAVTDAQHPQHNDAKTIMAAQIRLLEACKEEQLPLVFPVGYQSQMGARWNDAHPNHLRQYRDGSIVDWGGRSACIYSLRYREDILTYYAWIIEEIVKPFSDVISMINLADEPSGADFSPWAGREFERRYNMTFEQAESAGCKGARALGEFKARYMVDYARWSAEQWDKLDPGRPTTMSFCGFHGREEGCMPHIPDVFRLTPETFQPTWGVYPRDGDYTCPIKETDITPLIIFLHRLAYLSTQTNRPYWLWTTGNSWGLGQNSGDKGNIADAVANVLYVASSALRFKSHLKGIAVWNYNIKTQGLYNDTNPIVYDPDDMFDKVTKTLSLTRDYMERSSTADERRARPQAVITASKDYVFRFIGKSEKIIQFSPVDFSAFHRLAKSNATINLHESIAESARRIERLLKTNDSVTWLILTDSEDEEFNEPGTWNRIKDVSRKSVRVVLPKSLIEKGIAGNFLSQEHAKKLECYEAAPDEKGVAIHETPFRDFPDNRLYHFTIGGTSFLYNLTGKPVSAKNIGQVATAPDDSTVYVISPAAEIVSVSSGNAVDKCPPIQHHGMCVIGKENEYWMTIFNIESLPSHKEVQN